MPNASFDNEIRYVSASGVHEYEEAVGRRRCYRLLFVSDGIAFCTVNGKKCQFGQGDVIFLRKNDDCVFFSRSGADTRVCALIFGEGVFGDLSAFLPGGCLDSAAGGKEPPVVRKSIRYLRERNAEGPFEADCLLYEEVAEATEAWLQRDKEHCLEELAQCGAVILRMMEFVEKEK